MKPILAFLTALLLTPLAALHAASTPRPATQPNIIYILADDFGLPDIGCYGSDNHNGKILSGDKSKFGPDLLHGFVVDFIRERRDQPFFINKASTVNPATPPATEKPAKKSQSSLAVLPAEPSPPSRCRSTSRGWRRRISTSISLGTRACCQSPVPRSGR
jgi:hypothetical protein